MIKHKPRLAVHFLCAWFYAANSFYPCFNQLLGVKQMVGHGSHRMLAAAYCVQIPSSTRQALSECNTCNMTNPWLHNFRVSDYENTHSDSRDTISLGFHSPTKVPHPDSYRPIISRCKAQFHTPHERLQASFTHNDVSLNLDSVGQNCMCFSFICFNLT